MNSFFYRSAGLLFLFVCIVSCSPSLDKHFKSAKVFEQGFTGLAIYDPQKEEMLYQYNSHKYFTPASNTKLLTLYAGLKYLEDSIPAFRYIIRNDSLIFTTTGDPSFLNPKFENSAALDFLKDSQKDLFYVKSNWQNEAFGPGWAWDDYNYAFSAEKSAFPVYGNLISFQFSNLNKTFNVEPEYFKDSIYLHNDGKALHRNIHRNTFSFSPSSLKNYSRAIPFKTSEETSLALLREKLNKNIFYLKNDSLRSELNKELYSIPADSLYKEMLVESDNFIAEQILLMVSLKISDSLKSDITISNIQKKDFKDLPDEIFWVDGSGLSRYNLITPRTMVKVLEKIKNLKDQSELIALLPEAGKEGTLKNFLSEEQPFVFAKSGSLRNNYSLSGFLTTSKGKTLIFSFMNSNYTVPSQKLKEEMGQILLKIRNKY
ncbi:D-alanyl-D-alanine carboxypeptidase/D-alanyl-D-alanine endopeptidase [Christiangramia sediminis]|uniref:D-alanyl-D-alanine carboxypeptidase/D-alanyl-D-alanine-endopeptidase n=1 Tax=Christiangramia sediminis TaxID=2881336 RepID=A0A9X1LIU0_9FLAO|nr:D-alanyl-D-alanine carboxypeptidase/D-alanyl-D-alanine-endopeptidase [Christiangramia sediminis]MCB7481148.1 D-alanyl-D-alanine carboxypeptidase/D-alanyl-D-alanine-endopeptidase [Christiangramia sediminis]